MPYENIIENYISWIKDNTILKETSDADVRSISTPFLDRHNDHVEIYVQKVGDVFRLTDDGYTLADLKMSGLDLNTPKRESILRITLNGFGVTLAPNGELFTEANLNNIGQKKHHLVQAILAVNDMFVLAQETVFSLFKEDVELFFRTNKVVFSRDIKLSGKSGFDHNIDFLLPAFDAKPERLIKAVNVPKKDSILSSIMALTDVEKLRPHEVRNFVIYNDREKEPTSDIVNAMLAYSIVPVAWSAREEHISDFVLN